MSTSAISPQPLPNHLAAAGLFLLTAALTSVWIALVVAVPEFQSTGASSNISRVIIHVLVLIGLWIALTRAGYEFNTRLALWAVIVVPYTAWYLLIRSVAIDGIFVPGQSRIPVLPIAILLPILLGAPLLSRSKTIGTVLDAMPAPWLIALQAYRVLGGIFLVGWAQGKLSSYFALPAGTGDVLVGLLALPVAYYASLGSQGGRRLGIAWNILGILDLSIAISMGILTSPGPQQLFPPDRPNALLGLYPTVMIPAFAVPSSILFHVLSIRQLVRLGHKNTSERR